MQDAEAILEPPPSTLTAGVRGGDRAVPVTRPFHPADPSTPGADPAVDGPAGPDDEYEPL